MNSTILSLIAFAVMMGGAYFGAVFRKVLPDQVLADDSKEVVRLGSGLVGTLAALVLGLLIASAKSSYDTQNNQLREMTADIVLLDLLLAQYGPEASTARVQLRRAIGPLVQHIWRTDVPEGAESAPFKATAAGEAAYAQIQVLTPQNDAQTSLKARAIALSTELARARMLLFEQSHGSVPMPFLAILIFWLTVIFMSFSLFSRPNATVIAVLVVVALSASAAIFLILGMSQPFTGPMQIPSASLRNALAQLGP
jgi:hypothetical protein